MGVFDDLKKTQPFAKKPVIKAKKRLHKGFLFGHISNGNGLVKLDDGYALKFIVLDDNFIELYLLDYGKELTIKTQTWQKTKAIKKETKRIEVKEEAEEEKLF